MVALPFAINLVANILFMPIFSEMMHGRNLEAETGRAAGNAHAV